MASCPKMAFARDGFYPFMFFGNNRNKDFVREDLFTFFCLCDSIIELSLLGCLP